jgi:hypothetical protein
LFNSGIALLAMCSIRPPEVKRLGALLLGRTTLVPKNRKQ